MSDILDTCFPGALVPGTMVPFMHKGVWAIHQVLPILLSRIGPARVSVATFNISEDSLRTLFFLNEDKQLQELRLLLDMNVRRHKLGLLLFAGGITPDILLGLAADERDAFVEMCRNHRSSNVYEAYHRGRLTTKYELRKTVIRLAKAGSPAAEPLADAYLKEQNIKK